jgi:hypothetical protein
VAVVIAVVNPLELNVAADCGGHGGQSARSR